ncbi:PspC domain-containing protein [Lacticigenium naphthae]|uniref:PspC domain-containing protein n=1 Tax=Lacticigenium naphthae TaxID=515351 RepID=UPI0003FD47F4|nr:PspC domain-containing protein [Lacticigenium naphthae]
MGKRLTKSSDDQVFFGVIGGIGEFFGIDPTILRVIVAVMTFIGVGSTIPLYILLAILLPEDNISKKKSNKKTAFTQKDSTERKRKEVKGVDEDDWSDF